MIMERTVPPSKPTKRLRLRPHTPLSIRQGSVLLCRQDLIKANARSVGSFKGTIGACVTIDPLANGFMEKSPYGFSIFVLTRIRQ